MVTYNDAKTRLLTLLNVSHLRELKRNPDFSASADPREPPAKRVKLNQRVTQAAEPLPKSSNDAIASAPGDSLENDGDDAEAGAGAIVEDDLGELVLLLKGELRLMSCQKTQRTRTTHSPDTSGQIRQYLLRKHGRKPTQDYGRLTLPKVRISVNQVLSVYV